MSGAPLLLVEDDAVLAQFIAASLGAAGHRVQRAGDAAQALHVLRRAACLPHLLILDLGLPDRDGMEVIAQLRAEPAWRSLPVLVLSARHQEGDKIGALDAGADDYLTKPFAVGELLARVRAMLRRTGQPPAPVLNAGGIEIDLAAHRVRRNGEPVHLSPIEFKLLACLAARPGQVVTHRQLLTAVWGAEQIDQLHYLRIYMGHLRAKLEENPAQPRVLLTELGVGYRLADE